MIKYALSVVVAAALVLGTVAATNAPAYASGGSVKPVTTRIAGVISKIETVVGGVKFTIGTSYYATGSAIANRDTKLRLNRVEVNSPSVFRVGDFAEIDVIVGSGGVAYKLEATR